MSLPSIIFFVNYENRANLHRLGYSDQLIDSLRVEVALKLSESNEPCPNVIPSSWFCPFRNARTSSDKDSTSWTAAVKASSKKRSAGAGAGASYPCADSDTLSTSFPELTFEERIRMGVNSRLEMPHKFSSKMIN
jgi:hypothetical protein